MHSGRITASNRNITLVSIVIKQAIGLHLGKVEQDLEKDFQEKNRADKP